METSDAACPASGTAPGQPKKCERPRAGRNGTAEADIPAEKGREERPGTEAAGAAGHKEKAKRIIS